jgi:hypothetical protein
MTGLLALALAGPPSGGALELPTRIHRIVLHCPGGPSYPRPERRWVFLSPKQTQALWKRSFGTHWILWTDGSLWPRTPRRGDPPSAIPPVEQSADAAWRERIAREALPVYSHVHAANADTVGIEVAHSGRSDQTFPPAQVRSLAWLLRTLLEMSGGRLTPASIVAHKDMDERPAYVSEGCERPGCAFFVDGTGQPFRRRVDPPESLFVALAAAGLAIPRPAGRDDELLRAEALPAAARPAVARQ